MHSCYNMHKWFVTWSHTISNLGNWLLHGSLGVIKIQLRFKVCNISYLRVLFHNSKDLYSRKNTNLVFLALSRVARFYATTEQKLIHSFWNALRIRRKINQLHQSSCYTSSIYYTTQNNPWICRYRFNGKVFLIFSVSPLIHVKLKKSTVVSYI